MVLHRSSCRECEWAELPRWKRLRIKYFPTTAEVIQNQMSLMSGMTSAMTGTPRESLYEFHKRRYIETGDEMELRRMERHLK